MAKVSSLPISSSLLPSLCMHLAHHPNGSAHCFPPPSSCAFARLATILRLVCSTASSRKPFLIYSCHGVFLPSMNLCVSWIGNRIYFRHQPYLCCLTAGCNATWSLGVPIGNMGRIMSGFSMGLHWSHLVLGPTPAPTFYCPSGVSLLLCGFK